jgi:hypothetical protein
VHKPYPNTAWEILLVQRGCISVEVMAVLVRAPYNSVACCCSRRRHSLETIAQSLIEYTLPPKKLLRFCLVGLELSAPWSHSPQHNCVSITVLSTLHTALAAAHPPYPQQNSATAARSQTPREDSSRGPAEQDAVPCAWPAQDRPRDGRLLLPVLAQHGRPAGLVQRQVCALGHLLLLLRCVC